MEVDLALIADAATIDSSGKLSILGIFDRIGTSSFPAQHPHMVLVLRFIAAVNEAGKHQITIALKDPAGREVVGVDGEMQLGLGPAGGGSGIRVPHVLHLDGLVFPVPGLYAFDVRVDGEHHVSLPLTVYGPESSAMA
ncbi:MAG TPA: hypothetical protein EYM78_17260 [Gemmatimonadetes bacterium]|nr:hypothetical protein [Gemmatimonadota bacterium]HIC54162.1 hypothetical protein [Gemmatimonadota bacterium]HIN52429.1 hypothetical protein [Gemmatimonadota bacterium]|tara:strand:+ start:2648 stop:3061 length:414 start_codon:yes stop_codon:yes gene_type:complete